MSTYTIERQIRHLDCWSCGITFGMSSAYYDKLCKDGDTFFCPKGCRLSIGEGEVSRLKKALESEKEAKDRYWNQYQAARKERDHHWTERKKLQTRHRNVKKRIANGVCPCCNRTFSDLAGHMKTKHPKYIAEE